MSQEYRCQRFWVPSTEKIELDSSGFAADPELYDGALQPHAKALIDLIAAPRLVLLGEAGAGKSTALQNLKTDLEKKVGEEQLLFIQLANYTEATLDQDLFRSAKFINSTKPGSGPLYIVLDSLDEALLGVYNIAGYFERNRENILRDNVHLIISCRPALWPEFLTVMLGNPLLLNLMPLRKGDVETIASHNPQRDATAFMAAILEHETTLAVNPLTLNLLLVIFSETGTLPESRSELFKRGLEKFCETDKARSERGHGGSLNQGKRFKLAQQIAVYCILTNRNTIYLGGDDGRLRNSLGSEFLQNELNINEGVLKEVLGTGLFTRQGANLVCFAHHSYAEFLAAQQLRTLPFEQIEQKLFLPNPDQEYLVPKLIGTALWLVSFGDPDCSKRLCNKLLACQVAELLQSDLTQLEDPGLKRQIVEKFFNQLVKKDADFKKALFTSSLLPSLKSLKYADLAKDLGTEIVRNPLPEGTLYLAAKIARDCQLQELSAKFLVIARDPARAINDRVSAATAVQNFNYASCSSLKILLEDGYFDDDSEDTLRVTVLAATWPKHLSAKELFAALTIPKTRSLSYIMLLGLHLNIAENLESADLLPALAWSQGLYPEFYSYAGRNQEFDEVSGQIAYKAWQNLDCPGVLAALSKLALLRCRHLTPVFSVAFDPNIGRIAEKDASENLLAANPERRRQLLLAMATGILDNDRPDVLFLNWGLLRPAEDYNWLVDQRAANTNATQAEALKMLWGLLNSNWESKKEALAVKTSYYQQQEKHRLHAACKPQKQVTEAKIMARIDHATDFSAADSDLERFYRIAISLAIDTRRPNNIAFTHLPICERWPQLGLERQKKIIAVAKSLLARTQVDQQLAMRQQSSADRVFVLALALLCSEYPGYIAALPPAFWSQRIFSILLSYDHLFAGSLCISGVSLPQGSMPLIAQLALAAAPAEARSSLWRLINIEPKSHVFDYLEHFNSYLDDDFADKVQAILKDDPWSEEEFIELLSWLLRGQKARGEACATFLLEQLTEQPKKARRVVRALLQHDKGEWGRCWPFIAENAAWGEEVMLYLAGRRFNLDFAALSEPDNIALVNWFYQNKKFWPQSASKSINIVFVTSELILGDWRGFATAALRKRGTDTAINALSDLLKKYPGCEETLGNALAQAQATQREQSWQPSAPEELSEVIADQNHLQVRSAGELLELTCKSLDRLSNRLNGNHLEVGQLWNIAKVKKNVVLPANDKKWHKGEADLSNYITNRLVDDFAKHSITIACEPVLSNRTHSDGVPGNRADILVEYTAKDTRYRVILELKWSDNPGMKTSMRKQLVERYLKDSSYCKHGIYLVGWCDKVPSWGGIDETKAELKQQAEMINQEILAPQGGHLQAYVLDCSLK